MVINHLQVLKIILQVGPLQDGPKQPIRCKRPMENSTNFRDEFFLPQENPIFGHENSGSHNSIYNDRLGGPLNGL